MTIHYLPVDQIEVGERHRKTFVVRSLAELKTSILSASGLLHPIVVRVVNDSFHLIVGERRIRAIREIYEDKSTFHFAGLDVEPGTIPVILAAPMLTDTDILEAELNENLHREDLTWQERVDAISELHARRTAQDPTHSYIDTFREISPAAKAPSKLDASPERRATNATRIANAELIAQHLDDEDVRNAPSERDALRIVTQKLETLFTRATVRPISTIHTLYHEDFREVDFEPGTFDTVITDPPYGMGVKDFGDAAKLRHEYTEDDFMQLHEDLINLLTMVCAVDAHVYLFCDIDHFHEIAKMFRDVGKKVFDAHHPSPWTVRRAPLIWSKGNSGHLSEGDVYGFRRSYEFILHARRGNKSHRTLINDIIPVTPARNKEHAAEKPAELYTLLMKSSTYSGERVFDPFAGSGPIFTAATAIGAFATGCEISEKYVEHIEAKHNLRRT